MLIWELATTDAVDIRRTAIGCAMDAEAYVRDDERGSLIVCAGDDPRAAGVSGAKQMSLRFTAGRCGRQGGDWLFHVGLWTPEDFRVEFLAWYELEHLPILLECPTWEGCRFVEQKVGNGCQFYAMHQLADRAALDSAERKRSRATPWFKRLSVHPWFDGAFTRTLYRRSPA
jgi:hypothetical protein